MLGSKFGILPGMICSRLVRALALLLAGLLLPLAGHADWINLTGAETSPNIAEIYVLDDRVKLVLEIYVGDLEKFEELVPDDWLNDTRQGGRCRNAYTTLRGTHIPGGNRVR